MRAHTYTITNAHNHTHACTCTCAHAHIKAAQCTQRTIKKESQFLSRSVNLAAMGTNIWSPLSSAICQVHHFPF